MAQQHSASGITNRGWSPPLSTNPVRCTNQNTALSLMRTGVLDAMQGLLLERKWSSITMVDVSSAAGISRGTLYNEFRSRMGLARSYALRLADGIVTGMETAVYAHPGEGYGALQSAFRDFFDRIDSDPLVLALRTEDAPNDLLRMITVESQFIVDHASEQLSGTFQRSWMSANQNDADVLGHAIVRAALSFLALPPTSADAAATAIAQLLTPYIEAIRTPRVDTAQPPREKSSAAPSDPDGNGRNGPSWLAG
jgi:AcrR family transcriptional regulator